MRLRSVDSLDLQAAWRRVMSSVRSEELADRLPFELMHRLINAGHRELLHPTTEHSAAAPIVFFAPKESRTLRPLVAVAPRDLLIYQALVDQATEALRKTMPPDHVVYAYRLGEASDDRPIQNRSWLDFQNRARDGLQGGYSHILETDVAGFFLHIRPTVIVQRLLAIGVKPDVCEDLGDLLAHFQVDGVVGLPQGIAASSALSNLALLPVDRALEQNWDVYFRWSDDLRYLATSFADGYAAQERLERLLYGHQFSLGGGKTFIRKAATALARMEDLEQSLANIRDQRLRDAMAALGPYDEIDAEDLAADAGYQAAEQFYEEVIEPVRNRRWSRDRLFRTKLRFILRTLGRFQNPAALPDAVQTVFRYPDLIPAVSRYMQKLADTEPSEVRERVAELAEGKRVYMGEYLRFGLAIASAPLAAEGPAPKLSKLFLDVALDDGANVVVRRRTAMAAAALAESGDPSIETMWQAFQTIPDHELSRLYLVAGMSGHVDRDSHYGRWRGESRLLTAAMEYLSANSLDLSKV